MGESGVVESYLFKMETTNGHEGTRILEEVVACVISDR